MAVVVASEVIDFKWRERTNKVASWDRVRKLMYLQFTTISHINHLKIYICKTFHLIIKIFRIAQTTTIIVIFLVWLIGQATFDEKSCSRLSRNVEKYFKSMV